MNGGGFLPVETASKSRPGLAELIPLFVSIRRRVHEKTASIKRAWTARKDVV